VLVAKGATRDLNPSLSQSVIDRHYERDPAAAAAEFGAEFRTDLEAFVSIEAVEACVGDYREMAPSADQRYFAFVDPSGGSVDSFTLAIGHKDRSDKRIVIDVVREMRPPFSPEEVIAEFAALCRTYRIYLVIGDRYGGEFPREGFRKFSISTSRVPSRNPICIEISWRCSTANAWCYPSMRSSFSSSRDWSGAPRGADVIRSTMRPA
jgi:hypothetical protein